jgi:hypothetical protein
VECEFKKYRDYNVKSFDTKKVNISSDFSRMIATEIVFIPILGKSLRYSTMNMAECSLKCFKFHYLVSQSIHVSFFLPKNFFVSIFGVLIFCTKSWIYTRQYKLAHILCICGSIFTFLDIF